jgi:hypothetical protein
MDTITRWALAGWLFGLLGFASWAAAAPPRVAVAACDDGTGTDLGQTAPAGLARALEARGYQVLAPEAYAREAAERGFAGKKASGLNAIRALSKSLALAGVVTCATARVGPQFAAGFFLFGPDGTQLVSRPLRLGASELPPAQAVSLAEALAARLPQPTSPAAPEENEGPSLVPLAPVEPAPARTPTPAPAPDEPPAGLPLPEPVRGAPEPVRGAPEPERAAAPVARSTVERQAEPEVAPAAELAAATPDIRLALGASLQARAGLSPRTETGIYPGVRLEGRAFLGAFLDVPGLEDLGLGALYDRSFGLGFHSRDFEGELHAAQTRWQVELAYRLAFPAAPTGPTGMLRVGYGSLDLRIDGDFADVPEAGYTFLYAALGAELWLWRDWLSIRLAGGYVWSVWPSRRTSVAPGGHGQGFLVEAGLDLSLLEVLHVGVSYEQLQVVFDDRRLGETSERLQAIVVRLGWQWP